MCRLLSFWSAVLGMGLLLSKLSRSCHFSSSHHIHVLDKEEEEQRKARTSHLLPPHYNCRHLTAAWIYKGGSCHCVVGTRTPTPILWGAVVREVRADVGCGSCQCVPHLGWILSFNPLRAPRGRFWASSISQMARWKLED